MDRSPERWWRDVDNYLVETLVEEDDVLADARAASRAAGLPEHEVAPNQGKLLHLVCLMVGARRVLEFGTLGGYSTIWFARAVGPTGQVMTLEADSGFAEVARANLARAGVEDRVEVRLGPATQTSQQLIDERTDPFDVVFIDADKANSPAYLAASLALSRTGSVIIADNVVRGGAVTHRDSGDPRVVGTRALIEAMGRDGRLAATALQTVGVKGWDGFAIAVVR